MGVSVEGERSVLRACTSGLLAEHCEPTVPGKPGSVTSQQRSSPGSGPERAASRMLFSEYNGTGLLLAANAKRRTRTAGCRRRGWRGKNAKSPRPVLHLGPITDEMRSGLGWARDRYGRDARNRKNRSTLSKRSKAPRNVFHQFWPRRKGKRKTKKHGARRLGCRMASALCSPGLPSDRVGLWSSRNRTKIWEPFRGPGPRQTHTLNSMRHETILGFHKYFAWRQDWRMPLCESEQPQVLAYLLKGPQAGWQKRRPRVGRQFHG